MNSQKNQSKQWAKLIFCVLVIMLFIFGIAPMMKRLPYIQPIVQFVDEQGIDAGALYYTEIEEFSTAELNMNHTMRYPPTH